MAKTRNTVALGGEWLANTTMVKQLAAAAQRESAMKRDDMPFQRHWLYYLVLKYAVIAAAVVVTLFTAYRLYGEVESTWRAKHSSACGPIMSSIALIAIVIAVALASNYYLW